MEFTMSRAVAMATFNALGADGMITMFNQATDNRGVTFGLYCISKDWTYLPVITLIKLKGVLGDVLVKLT